MLNDTNTFCAPISFLRVKKGPHADSNSDSRSSIHAPTINEHPPTTTDADGDRSSSQRRSDRREETHQFRSRPILWSHFYIPGNNTRSFRKFVQFPCFALTALQIRGFCRWIMRHTQRWQLWRWKKSATRCLLKNLSLIVFVSDPSKLERTKYRDISSNRELSDWRNQCYDCSFVGSSKGINRSDRICD
jgi:hypothetical protein